MRVNRGYPEAVFQYSNTNYYLLSCILHRVTGCTLLQFLRENLFEPMDMEGCAWETCPPWGDYGSHRPVYCQPRYG